MTTKIPGSLIVGGGGGGGSGDMLKADNLSGLTNPATARNNLGLGTLATQNGAFSGTHSGSSSGTNTGDQDLSGLTSKSANLSDIPNPTQARTNLGIKSMALHNVTISTSDPSGGSDGDIWLKVAP